MPRASLDAVEVVAVIGGAVPRSEKKKPAPVSDDDQKNLF
jgi:hypothetical protein